MGQWKRYARESRKDARLKQCEDDIIEMSEKCESFGKSITCAITDKANSKIEQLVEAQNEVVKKLRRWQYYLKKNTMTS